MTQPAKYMMSCLERTLGEEMPSAERLLLGRKSMNIAAPMLAVVSSARAARMMVEVWESDEDMLIGRVRKMRWIGSVLGGDGLC